MPSGGRRARAHFALCVTWLGSEPNILFNVRQVMEEKAKEDNQSQESSDAKCFSPGCIFTSSDKVLK